MEGDSTQIDMLVGDIYGMTYCGWIRVTCFSQPKFKGYLSSRKVNMQHKDKLSPLLRSIPNILRGYLPVYQPQSFRKS
jgi:pantothenate kinase